LSNRLRGRVFRSAQAFSATRQADDQTGPALLHQGPELQVSNLGAMGDVVVDGLPYQLLGVLLRPPLQVDTHPHRRDDKAEEFIVGWAQEFAPDARSFS